MYFRFESRSFYLVVCLLVLAGCGDSSGGNASPQPAAQNPPLPAPLPVPTPAVGDLLLTLDNSVAAAGQIPFDGGVISLDAAGGASFSLSFPQGAFLESGANVTMVSVVDVQGLPAELIPVAAVSLGPSGAAFARQPTLEIDLGSLSRLAGNVVLYAAADDGSGLNYLLPFGGDAVEMVLGDGPYRARVPHFSAIGIAVVDPNSAGLPAVTAITSSEALARQRINMLIDADARRIQMGQASTGVSAAEVQLALDVWSVDLRSRVQSLDNQSTLDEIKILGKEILRFEESQPRLSFAARNDLLDESELGRLVINVIAAQLGELNDRCVAGNANAPILFTERISFVRALAAAALIGQDTLDNLDEPRFCLSS